MEQLTRDEKIRRILEIAAQLTAEEVAAAISKVKASPVGIIQQGLFPLCSSL